MAVSEEKLREGVALFREIAKGILLDLQTHQIVPELNEINTECFEVFISLELVKAMQKGAEFQARLQGMEVKTLREALLWIEMDTRDPSAPNSRSNQRAKEALEHGGLRV